MFKFAILSAVLVSALLPAPKVQPVTRQQLNNIVQKQNDTLYVVNFWATWCVPCIKELPYFEAANQKFQSKKVKVVLVSLNSTKELPQLEKFITDKKIQSEVVLLNAGNPNNWIDSFDNTWSGAIPATIMYRGGKKILFHEGEFTQHELDSIIQNKNQPK